MFIFSKYWQNPVFIFICMNYTGLVVHAIDGPIMLAFQPHMLVPLKKLLGLAGLTKVETANYETN